MEHHHITVDELGVVKISISDITVKTHNVNGELQNYFVVGQPKVQFEFLGRFHDIELLFTGRM